MNFLLYVRLLTQGTEPIASSVHQDRYSQIEVDLEQPTGQVIRMQPIV